MSDYVVLRLLDSFFRHKLLHILPIVAFAALGVWYVASQEVQYQAKGVLLVEDETLLTSLTAVGGAGGTGWQTPADRVSGQINALLQTEAFVGGIAEASGLGSVDDLGPARLGLLQRSVGAYPVGENLVHVWSNSTDAETARALATATIDNVIEFQVDTTVDESVAAEGVLDPLTERYRDDLATARQAVEDHIRANPLRGGNRSPDAQLEIDELTTRLAEANARYTDALRKEESARLSREQARSAIEDRFQIVDRPKAPTSPLGRLRTRALALAVFVVVGGILALASVVTGAVLDQTIRYPQDLTVRLGANVLGVIPDASAWMRSDTPRDDHVDGAQEQVAT